MSTNTIPSTSGPNKVWMIDFLKSPGRAGYWLATEATREDNCLSFDLFGTRRVKGEPVPPPCTAKRQITSREALIATMRSQGLIAEAQP